MTHQKLINDIPANKRQPPPYSRLLSESSSNFQATLVDTRAEDMCGKTATHFWNLQMAKTKLCTHHAKARCLKGQNCLFAHSVDEIRVPPNLEKTRLCPEWVDTGQCLKSHCRYAHNALELRWTPDFYKTSLCPIWSLTQSCLAEDNCRYAHGQHELRSTFIKPQHKKSGKGNFLAGSSTAAVRKSLVAPVDKAAVVSPVHSPSKQVDTDKMSESFKQKKASNNKSPRRLPRDKSSCSWQQQQQQQQQQQATEKFSMRYKFDNDDDAPLHSSRHRLPYDPMFSSAQSNIPNIAPTTSSPWRRADPSLDCLTLSASALLGARQTSVEEDFNNVSLTASLLPARTTTTTTDYDGCDSRKAVATEALLLLHEQQQTPSCMPDDPLLLSSIKNNNMAVDITNLVEDCLNNTGEDFLTNEYFSESAATTPHYHFRSRISTLCPNDIHYGVMEAWKMLSRDDPNGLFDQKNRQGTLDSLESMQHQNDNSSAQRRFTHCQPNSPRQRLGNKTWKTLPYGNGADSKIAVDQIVQLLLEDNNNNNFLMPQ